MKEAWGVCCMHRDGQMPGAEEAKSATQKGPSHSLELPLGGMDGQRNIVFLFLILETERARSKGQVEAWLCVLLVFALSSSPRSFSATIPQVQCCVAIVHQGTYVGLKQTFGVTLQHGLNSNFGGQI